MRRVVPTLRGAIVALDGDARQWTRGKETLYLVYEAYEATALSEMKKLAVEVRKRFEIAHVGIVRRLGKLETSIGTAVAATLSPAATRL